MYLKNLTLNNFRSFEETEILFFSDLTILVGENNGGKSNAIDAIRLVTTPLGGRREIYCETTDIRLGSLTRHFELIATRAVHIGGGRPGNNRLYLRLELR